MRKILMAIGLAVLADIAQAGDIRPGLWKISLEPVVAATPDWKPQPFETTQCLTESDTQNPAPLLLGMSSPQATGCDFPSRQSTGNSFSFDVRCGGTLGITGHGQVSHTDMTLDGFLDVSFGEGEKITMQNKIHATYLGNCPSANGGL